MSGRTQDRCREFAPLLGRVSDGETTPDEALHVARHLSDCTACRIVLARETRLASMLERGMDDAIDEDESFVDEVMARLPRTPPPRASRRAGRRTLKLASFAAPLLVLAWLSLDRSGWEEVATTTWELTPSVAPSETGGFAEGAAQAGALVSMAVNQIAGGTAIDGSGVFAGLLLLLSLPILVPAALALSAGALWLWIKPTWT